MERILALNGGVEVAYECAGAEVTVGNAVSSIRKGGEVVIISIIPQPVAVDMLQLTVKEASIRTSFAYRHIFPEVIGLIAAGRIDVKQVVTAKIELDNIVEDGFKKLLTDKSQAKILVRLSGDN
ncbi:zinc-binding dehydrogenase [Paenibacillus sp. J5C_2022]|uniref:zinc-binding dehydrogenase n=1 Tax=Paenibacillus sp. J5C2022 TaxID=2977129 RepID=UPI0021D28181|nr:zinc-binding dehydrogenase [Paenibacillus sp. J5C2022]MCU6710577.1 zinc-binding dehydrogenase [Paenibacillus sp. J5C2022]